MFHSVNRQHRRYMRCTDVPRLLYNLACWMWILYYLSWAWLIAGMLLHVRQDDWTVGPIPYWLTLQLILYTIRIALCFATVLWKGKQFLFYFLASKVCDAFSVSLFLVGCYSVWRLDTTVYSPLSGLVFFCESLLDFQIYIGSVSFVVQMVTLIAFQYAIICFSRRNEATVSTSSASRDRPTATTRPCPPSPASPVTPLLLQSVPCTDPLVTRLCVICLSEEEVGQQVMVVPSCQHVFHKDCLSSWWSYSHHCPLCRAKIQPENS